MTMVRRIERHNTVSSQRKMLLIILSTISLSIVSLSEAYWNHSPLTPFAIAATSPNPDALGHRRHNTRAFVPYERNGRQTYRQSVVSSSTTSSSANEYENGGTPSLNGGGGDNEADTNLPIVIIGGGVSGLTAALTATPHLRSTNDDDNSNTAPKNPILILESSSEAGGRVRSLTENDRNGLAFTYDVGFAVFIENYPLSRKVFDYDELQLRPFLPGALVVVPTTPSSLSPKRIRRVSDPRRRKRDVFAAVASPVGTLRDKIRLGRLLYTVLRKSPSQLFDLDETSTTTLLREHYRFSERFVDEFFRPFLEGVFLAPLEEQSSRMAHFVLKMFFEGNVSLPGADGGGIGSASRQLVRRLERECGGEVSIRRNATVTSVVASAGGGGDDGGHVVTLSDGSAIRAGKVIVATDAPTAYRLLNVTTGAGVVPPPQRRVASLYYAFRSDPPVTEPILILNGGGRHRDEPVNNVCFPSVVCEGYAPPGWHLCSVTILEPFVDCYAEGEQELDGIVRRQLATWFPKQSDEIMTEWELKKVFRVEKAQPAQYSGNGGGFSPANMYGGRGARSLAGVTLPAGLYVCGDHTATATLNGALESGVSAGEALLADEGLC